MPSIILASESTTRIALLENAGVSFTAEGAAVDEETVKAPLLASDMPPDDIAAVLAEAKALAVSERHPDVLVIGADQTLAFRDACLSKPETMEDARRLLLDLSGRSHSLHAAVACAKNGETLWRYLSTAHLKMRAFSPEFVGRYLADVGEAALTSVGAYQLEGRGVQLFDEIDGDFFTILGLPMLPLLDFLRAEGAIDK